MNAITSDVRDKVATKLGAIVTSIAVRGHPVAVRLDTIMPDRVTFEVAVDSVVVFRLAAERVGDAKCYVVGKADLDGMRQVGLDELAGALEAARVGRQS